MEFLENISPRDYQQKIFETCKEKNCLVVLPTGLGKTLIALMLAIERIKKFPGERILFLAPTKPLAEQHLNFFKKHLAELFGDLQLFTGEVKAEKRREIWKTADIIFSTPQCVDGETLIFTEEGPIKISEFFKKFKFEEEKYVEGKGNVADIKEKVLGYNGQKIKFLEASKAWKLPGKGLIKLKTEIGNTLLCTKNHPLLTITSGGEKIWKEASQLSKGEYIASIKEIDIEERKLEIINLISNSESLKIADKLLVKKLIKELKEDKIKTSLYSRYFNNFMPIKLFLKLSKKVKFNHNFLTLTDNYGKSNPIKIPKYLDYKLAYIIGGMLGDGHLGIREKHGGEVVFSELDRNSICDEMKDVIKELFGVGMKKCPKGLVVYNSALSSLLSLLGIPKGNKSKIIHVPKFMFFADKNSIKGFIKGIFDTDGSASKYGVSISSASKEFIEELKWLFLRIGILGNIEGRENKGGRIGNRKIKPSKIFTFRFSGRENLQKFLTVNPDKDKCKKLIETLNNTKRPETRSKEILPVLELMKRIRNAHKGKIDYYKFSCLSIDNLRKITENLEGEDILKLKDLLNSPIRWVKIKEKKEYDEKKEVYDLTIEKNHNFIANCLINHNCIANDLKNNLYDLKDVCLLIEDEAHRCLKNYDYTYIAEQYKKNSIHSRILGLTASPGSDNQTIRQICRNLSIEEVELRTRDSTDIKHNLQELEFEKIFVDLPAEFWEIRGALKKIHDLYIEELKARSLLFTIPTKVNLIKLQGKLIQMLSMGNKNFNLFRGISACAGAIKLQHALELIETQTLQGFVNYLKTLMKQAADLKSKAVQNLVKSSEFNYAFFTSSNLLEKKIEHPKVAELARIIEKEKSMTDNLRAIVFSQYRDTAVLISKKLNEIPGIKAKIFVGQLKKGDTGLSQKEQKKTIEDFSSGKTNILCATSIGEEGLDIPEVNLVVFYEPVASAIRTIQRSGRTARLKKGKLIILITKKTRDESYYYVSRAKEKKMHSAIDEIKKEMQEKDFQRTLDKVT